MQTFADAEAVLRERLPGYESRPQQRRLAQAIEALFVTYAAGVPTQGRLTHLMGQASTGCGKSLAGLIPAILSGKRVVYSVTTKALQDQLGQVDLPFLEGNLGVPFAWCVLKGRANYWCTRMALSAEGDLSSLPEILRYVDDRPDWDGTRDTLPFDVPEREWSQMVSDAEACHDAGCGKDPEGGCYAERARAKARRSKVVVVNHALLCTDLQLKAQLLNGMLGEYDYVILDEAHGLEDVAGDSLGARMTEGSFRSLAREVSAWAHQYADEDAASTVAELARDLTAAAGTLFGPDGLPVGRVRTATLNENVDALAAVSAALRELDKAWWALDLEDVPTSLYDRAKARRKLISTRLANAGDRYRALLGADPGLVRWVEEETNRRRERVKVVRTCPVTVAPFLRQWLFERTPAVLVSATLAVNGRFDYVAGRLGVDSYASIDVGTPFDFQTQARLYVPSIPEPKGRDAAAWEEAVDEQVVELVRASQGRALVLFTSNKHMRECALRIRGRIPYTLMVQGDAPVPELARRFKAEMSSVLFGTRSFMTGMDFQGSTLTCLIMVKLPIPVPTEPLHEARCEEIERNGGKGFFDLSVPVTSLTLQQAVGRLIRCFDQETELLTTEGWKRYDQVRPGMIAYGVPSQRLGAVQASVRGAPALVENPVLAVQLNEQPEPMISIQAKSLNACVTPDHDMLVQPQRVSFHTAVSHKSYGDYEQTQSYTWTSGPYQKVLAKDLPSRFRVPQAGRILRRQNRIAKDWFALMGFIIADGSVSTSKNCITLHQSQAKPQFVQWVDDLLARLNIKANRYIVPKKGTTMTVKGKTYERTEDMVLWQVNGVDSARIRDMFAQGQRRRYSTAISYRRRSHRGTAGVSVVGWREVEKRIPRWAIQRGRRPQLLALIEGLMVGDGTGVDKPSGSFYTSDRVNADRFQELLALVGFRSVLSTRRGQWEISFFRWGSVDVTRSACVEEVQEKPSWCVTTECGTVLVRRGGSTYIAGNSSRDAGIVAILDPRTLTKGYGRQLLRDLPDMPRVANTLQITEFLASQPQGDSHG